MVSVLLTVEAAAMAGLPPEATRASRLIRLLPWCTTVACVTVMVSGMSIRTSLSGPGTAPVLQLLPTSQAPLAWLIHLTVEDEMGLAWTAAENSEVLPDGSVAVAVTN